MNLPENMFFIRVPPLNLCQFPLFKGGTLMKNRFFGRFINTPKYFAWWTLAPIPNGKCNKSGWDRYFQISLGLNTLPVSCVRAR